MKKYQLFLCSLMSVFCITGLTFATQLTYHDESTQDYWVDTSGSKPVYWVRLNFPSSSTGTYGNGGKFEYDNYANLVDQLEITLHGNSDNSSSTIDFFLDFNDNHTFYSGKIAGYDVKNNSPFTLTLDIKNNVLLYNGASVGPLSNVNLQSFVGYDHFWVGYACHFMHDKTEVNVAVDPVPEPSTMLLLGSGLMGLIGLRKKFKK